MTSLAITERKTNAQKHGGCVGIFFQLFDWSRRFSKKLFFPKKLLPPGRAKVCKKFNADEKLPVGKHLLIVDDENNGGFPSNVKKNVDGRVSLEVKKHEMQTPGLVARLMGLEVLPVNHGKSSKGSPSDDCKGKGGRLNVDSLSPEKGILRPQKVQKTGVLERRPVTRFRAEALQIKNALSRSRKHHHVKLASPVKSPKLGRNTSRLIDVAARILEPGIQATNRARCRLTYANSMNQSREEGVMTDANAGMDLQFQYGSKFSAPQTSCRSCGNFLERIDTRSIMEEQSTRFEVPTSTSRSDFLHGVEGSRSKPVTYLEDETKVVLLKTRYQTNCARTREEESIPVENEMTRMFTSQKNEPTSYKHKNRRQSQMLIGDRVPPRAKLVNAHARKVSSATSAVRESRDIIALNRNPSRTRDRVPSKSDNNIEPDRRIFAGKNDSLAIQKSPVRKRRTVDASRPIDTSISTNSLLEKQRSNKGNVMSRNRPKISANNADPTCVTGRPVTQRGSRETNVVSFTFSSPVKSSAATFSHQEMNDNTRHQMGQFSDENLTDKIVKDDNALKKLSQNSLRINGDALEALLEQKLKELKDNEEASGFSPSTRTTASILQELISALTADRQILHDASAHGTYINDSKSRGDIMDRICQSKSRLEKTSDSFSCKVDHLSPGCVIDVSSSNESCITSSIDDSSGHILRSDCTDLSFNMVQSAGADAELLDSASSTNNTKVNDLIPMTDLLTHTYTVLQNVNLVHTKLTGTKLDYVHEIVLNVELLFGNATRHSSSRFVDFLVGPFLDELESLVVAAWRNTVILGLEVRKEESSLRRFLFDCIVECLDIRYNRYSNCGNQILSIFPKCINVDVLIKAFDEEVRKWAAFAGKAPDEIIEKEMSTSLGKWTDFEIESFETASIINQELLHTLVDEIMMDLIAFEL